MVEGNSSIPLCIYVTGCLMIRAYIEVVYDAKQFIAVIDRIRAGICDTITEA